MFTVLRKLQTSGGAFWKRGLHTSLVGFSFSVILIPLLTFTVLIFGQIRSLKNVMFTVLSFGQVTKVFGLLYSVILQGRFR